VSVYAKNVVQQESVVTFAPQKLSVNIKFKYGKFFLKDFSLTEPILPEQSKFEFLSTKVEITLRKSNGVQWTKLES